MLRTVQYIANISILCEISVKVRKGSSENNSREEESLRVQPYYDSNFQVIVGGGWEGP